MRFLKLLFFFFGNIAFNQAQTIHYVNLTATGINTGVDWTNAFTDLHVALQSAQAGDQIWVASGSLHTSDTDDRTVYFELKSGVKLYGSFIGTESSIDERDIQTNPTLIDGDIGMPGDSTDNTYNLMYLPFPDSNTVVDGFVFKNALANDQTQQADQLRTSGSALFINGFNSIAYPRISNCTFENNTSLTSGGAVYITAGPMGSVAPRFAHCDFTKNRSLNSNGGAVYRSGSSFVDYPDDFLHCLFFGNFAAQSGGGIYFADASRSDTLHVVQCNFIKNRANAQFGGGVFLSGRQSGSLITLQNTLFEENYSRIGGGLVFYSESAPIKQFNLMGCVFKNNIATGFSSYANDCLIYSGYFNSTIGKVLVSSCHFFNTNYPKENEIVGFFEEISIVNCEIIGSNPFNISATGKIFFSSNKIIAATSYIRLVGGSNPGIQIFVFNNLFFNNKSIVLYIFKPALYCGNIFANNEFDLNYQFNGNIESNLVLNNIFFNNFNINLINVGYGLPFNQRPYELSNNILADFTDCDALPGLATCTSGNLFAVDPMFVDTAAGDFSLLPCSPAINAGLDSLYAQLGILTDFAGNPRILDGQSDIGALESLSLSASTDPVVDPTCINANNGSATFNIIGGCEPYSFAWSSEAGTTGSDTTELAAGTYHFTITDQQGKTYEQTLVVDETQAIQIGSDITKATCGACPDGSIQVQPLTGAEPFVYLWNNGDTSASLQGLLPGIYTLTVIDAWGCDQVFAYTVDFFIGTAEPGWNDGCTVSPNPVVDVAVFRMNQGLFNGQRIRVTDELGREVHTGIAYGSAYTWRPSGLPGGWYVWHVVEKSGRQMDSGRIIIP